MSHGVFCSHHCELGELRQAGLREMKGCQLQLDGWQIPDILAMFWGAPGAGQGGGWAMVYWVRTTCWGPGSCSGNQGDAESYALWP